MKKRVIALMTALLLLCAGSVYAQEDIREQMINDILKTAQQTYEATGGKAKRAHERARCGGKYAA